ncbi:MAG: DUF4175 domain-containing protein [Planctomycetes bacterium]|nr:DUF4175 domain-containing protein [Planctomycetota bacterium]
MEKAVQLLAWSALGVALLFVAVAMTALFRWDALGSFAEPLAWWGAVPLISLALLLSVGVLVTAWLSTGSDI